MTRPFTGRDCVSDVPDGWLKTALRDLVDEVQPGFACGTHNRDGQGIGQLRPMNVSQDGQINLSTVKFVPKGYVDRDERWLRFGDVIFNNTNSPELVGKTALYSLPEPRAFSNHMTRVRCNRKALDPAFCAAYLHQKWRTGYFFGICNNHVSQASVASGVLLDTLIELPPFAEQKRIVAKVEELLARVNAARERLAKAPALLKRFRQSVLAAACSGQLTADWREQHPNSEPSVVRKERLLRERKQLWERTTIGRRAYRPPFEVGNCGPFELPRTWCWATVSHLSLQDVGFAFKSAEFVDRGVRLLRGENVEPGSLRWTDTEFWPKTKATDFAHLFVKEGDIILAMDRPVISTGLKIARAKRSDLPCLLVQRVMRFQMVESESTPFLFRRLQHPDFIEFLAHDGMTGSDLPHITGTGVAEFPVPLAPLPEEREIVRRVEALFELADKIENRVASATARVEKITQSILAKAFRGELVPTEAELARQEGRDYEPASVLLERIKAETSRRGAEPRRRKKKERT